MRNVRITISMLMIALCAAPASAQFGQILKRGKQAKQVADASAVWTAEQEQAIGDASAAKLVAVLGLYDNPAMNHYVSSVGAAVATHITRPMTYKFGILDREIIGAFGLPGGYVFVTRGALANMKNEAELAGVLAHEIAHIDSRHLEKEIRAKKLTGIAASEGFEQLGNRVPFGSYLQQLGQQVVTQVLTEGYNQDKESEADRKGTEFAAATGYDASGLKNFLETMRDAASKDPEAKKKTGMYSGKTHPTFDQRIAELTPLAAQFPGGVTNEQRFQQGGKFGPTVEELAAQKRAEEEAAAAKKAAEAKASGPKAQPSKATTKSRFSKPKAN